MTTARVHGGGSDYEILHPQGECLAYLQSLPRQTHGIGGPPANPATSEVVYAEGVPGHPWIVSRQAYDRIKSQGWLNKAPAPSDPKVQLTYPAIPGSTRTASVMGDHQGGDC